MEKESHLAAIMFTDLVGYSSLMQENETLAVELLNIHREIVRDILPRHAGEEIKTIGDAFLVEFASSIRAVKCAAEIQSRHFSHNNLQPKEKQIHLRIGIHIGDIIHDNGDIVGDGVNIASRIEPHADAGGICISGQVYDQVSNKLDFSFIELKNRELKNIKQEIRLFSVELPWNTVKEEPTVKKKRSFTPVMVGVGIVVFISIAGFLLFKMDYLSGVDDNSIAVLPFRNMSADKDNEYFSDGMTEEILNSLAQIKELRVISRTSVFTYKHRSDVGIAEIGRELDVSYVLEGSVRKVGNKVRITAQLIRSKDDAHLWSQTYDRSLDDIFQVQTEISEAIAQQMKIELIAENLNVRRGITHKPEALELYMQASFFMNKMTDKSIKEAITLYKDAITIDPQYALAYAGIANCYIALDGVNYYKYFKSDDIENYTNAKTYSQKALDIEPKLGEALTVVARMKESLDKDYDEADRLYNKAIEYSPDYAMAYHSYGRFLNWRYKDFLKSRAMYKRALSLDPLSPNINASAGEVYLAAQGRLYSREVENDTAYYYLNKAFQLDPNYVNGNHLYLFTELLENRHEMDRAETLRNKAFELDPNNFTILFGMTYHYIMRWDLEKAKFYLEKLIELGFSWPSAYAIEGWYHFFGENNIDDAIPYLKKAIYKNDYGFWIVWYRLMYALGSSDRCSEIERLNFDKVWSEYSPGINNLPKKDQYLAEKIISTYSEFYCGDKENALNSLNNDASILDERPNSYEHYFYLKAILLLESGDIDGALDILEKTYDFTKASYYLFIKHPAFLPYKDNQRYQSILKNTPMK